MEITPSCCSSDIVLPVEPVAAPSFALLNATPDSLLVSAAEFQGNLAALEFLQPSTSDDFKYETNISCYSILELTRAVRQLTPICTQSKPLHTI
jgi:hypothetical protein